MCSCKSRRLLLKAASQKWIHSCGDDPISTKPISRPGAVKRYPQLHDQLTAVNAPAKSPPRHSARVCNRLLARETRHSRPKDKLLRKQTPVSSCSFLPFLRPHIYRTVQIVFIDCYRQDAPMSQGNIRNLPVVSQPSLPSPSSSSILISTTESAHGHGMSPR